MRVYENSKREKYIIHGYQSGYWMVEEEKTRKVESLKNYQLIEFVKVFKLKRRSDDRD